MELKINLATEQLAVQGIVETLFKFSTQSNAKWSGAQTIVLFYYELEYFSLVKWLIENANSATNGMLIVLKTIKKSTLGRKHHHHAYLFPWVVGVQTCLEYKSDHKTCMKRKINTNKTVVEKWFALILSLLAL